MRVRIQHTTTYEYEGAAAFGPHLIRLRPAGHARAHLLSYNLKVEPGGELRWQHDPWGNSIARLTFPDGFTAELLRFQVDAAFEIRPVNPFDFYVDDDCQQLPFSYPELLRAELAPFLRSAAPGPRLARWLEGVPAVGYVTDHLVALTQRVARDVRYILRDEPGVQTSEQTLERGSGSCRDSAVLLVDAFRAQGLAARFVSGYLIQLTDEGNLPDHARGVSRDVIDLHAWCEVFVPGGGWIGLDGTSGLLCNEGHIPLACTVRPEMAAPLDGTTNQPARRFSFSMNIERLGHEPSPRRPYTDEQWQEALAAGDRADERLEAAGLALTMGGEPTFSSREHPREPEWSTEALGATKEAQGRRLAALLAERLAAGTLILERMGKLYPGESLPRWVLHLLWRADGEPVWRDPSRLASLVVRPGVAPAREATSEEARRFGESLAARLGVGPNLVAGHEDPWVAIFRERNVPPDVDPAKADLGDPEQRRTLARVLQRGLGEVVGYALPLQRVDEGWRTSPWSFRAGPMYLLPGDSPLGLRLPLDRLEGEAVELPERDVSAVDAPLPPWGVARAAGPPLAAAPSGTVRTALCLEVRGGVVHVFLPPVAGAEDFLELVAAIEQTAGELGLAVRLEGYPPPSDPRLRSCLVTPDPGVIEVNLPVTRGFPEYVRTLEIISDAALRAGLCAEKYQLDGREVGSGGGNHLTLGGPTAVQSPFLRRPDLLASVLRYVQNHPSLSFLFTGLFVGPTSQAPRVDEARHDALRELEIALSHLQKAGPSPPPWLGDRLLRNLLVDVAGNTHRTEICIDKLYDPATTHGRQGLLELRAFEMPPHERMAAAQMLLVRSLVAAFAERPYTRPLVRWGTELHDRFLLPHYLWADIEEVLRDLGDAGLPLAAGLFRPFLDYRFPLLGTLAAEDLVLELRPALEPWPVLGEEPTGASVSRYVDSSLERLEVRVTGLVAGRHAVLVNGLTVPLRPTGRAGERVGGVRFRAWQPPHCLQPHIGVHHPLRFDLVDLWGKRSLGGCTHHVWHPEGRAYEEPPLTAFEAAARRAQRFSTRGHQPWPVVPIKTRVDPEHPYTLDLRLYPGDRRQEGE